jgi:hypothetical protein
VVLLQLFCQKGASRHNRLITLMTASPFGSYWPQNEVKSPPEFYSATRDQYLMRSIKLSLNWEFGELFQAGHWNAYYYTHAHHQFRDSWYTRLLGRQAIAYNYPFR